MKCECPDYYHVKFSDGDVEVYALIEAIIYQRGWDGIDAYDIGNVIKYIMRAGAKESRADDLRKARNYISFILARLEREEDAVY